MLSPNSNEVTYNPGVFDVASETQAKRIILTPEGDQLPEQRWFNETPYLTELILAKVPGLDQNSFVLDYGCGIGRLSRELIKRTGCRVVGVDISPSMRSLAASYVCDDLFFSCSPVMFEILVSRHKIRFDLVLSVWVLQHCLEPQEDISLIHRALQLNGKLFVVNNKRRVVPTVERGWVDDDIDIHQMLVKKKLVDLEIGSLDPAAVPQSLVDATFWALYKK